jgi:hypothetical protein
MMRNVALAACAVAVSTASAWAAPETFNVPVGVKLPEVEPLISACADPAADRFIEVDISQRPPAGSTRIQRLSGWVTADNIFHWPLIVRLRNIGDKPFVGKPGAQRAVVTEDDLKTGKKGRVIQTVPFDRIPAHGGVGVRFEFAAPVAEMQKQSFHRVFKLSIKYDRLDAAIVDSSTGDCNLRNNEWSVEFNGGRKGWIFAR